jgi:broad specificity phosphatase PhoE
MWENRTTISLPTETRDRFAQLKRPGESWDDTVRRVVDQVEEIEPQADGGDRQ